MSDKKPASTSVLGELHSLVASVLTKQLKLADGALSGELSAEQIEALTGALGETKVSIGAAIAFLKNNSITASVEDNDDLRELKDELARTRTRGKQRLSASDLEDAAKQFEQLTGGSLQ